MNTTSRFLGWSALLLVTAVSLVHAAGEKKDYPPHAARDTLQAAFQKAEQESKAVFAKSGYPECGWCRVFDRFHDATEVKEILGKYYVIVSIDTSYMPDGKEVFSKYAKPGAPSWVILTPQGKVVIDSYGPDGNAGYPLMPNETAHYLTALKKATPKITPEELEVLSRQIQKAAGK